MADKIRKSDVEWREQLTDDEYRVAREHGTERAFTGRYCCLLYTSPSPRDS